VSAQTATRRRAKAAAVVTLIALALSLSACGGSSSVSAGAYAHSVCSATQSFKQGGQAAVAQYQSSVARATTVASVKQQLQAYLGSMTSYADKFISQIKAAGTPNVTNGQQFASTLLSAFQEVRGAFSQAKSQVDAVPTTSVTAFRSAATAVKSTLSTANARLSNLGLTKNPQLHAASLKDTTCQALKSGA
jgi:hypothetical protein